MNVSAILRVRAYGHEVLLLNALAVDRHGSPPASANGRVDVTDLRCEQGAARLSTAATRLAVVVVGRLGSEAVSEHLLQGCRPAMLFEQVAKRLVSELLDRLHPILRQPVERVPGGRVEGNAA